MRRPWTKAEDELLRQNLPKHGPSWEGWSRVLPGRTKSAIMARKKKLKVTGPRAGGSYGKARKAGDDAEAASPASSPWTDSQRIDLVEHAMAVTRLTGHSLGECAVELARIVKEYRKQKKG